MACFTMTNYKLSLIGRLLAFSNIIPTGTLAVGRVYKSLIRPSSLENRL